MSFTHATRAQASAGEGAELRGFPVVEAAWFAAAHDASGEAAHGYGICAALRAAHAGGNRDLLRRYGRGDAQAFRADLLDRVRSGAGGGCCTQIRTLSAHPDPARR